MTAHNTPLWASHYQHSPFCERKMSKVPLRGIYVVATAMAGLGRDDDITMTKFH